MKRLVLVKLLMNSIQKELGNGEREATIILKMGTHGSRCNYRT